MKNLAYFFIIAIGIILTLVYGQNIIIQLIIASLLWFVTVRLKKLANKSKIFSRFIPAKLQLLAILTLLILILYFVINAVLSNLSGLLASFHIYEQNITVVTTEIDNLFKINIEKEINSVINSLDIKSILSQLAEGLSNILSQSMMILIYLLFIFLETDNFKLKISAFFSEPSDKQKFTQTLDKIASSLSGYFRVKTLMSFLTGFLSFIVLKIVGIEAPTFWAFLIFLLNYIPTIGSLIATVFPAVFSLLQFGNFVPFAVVLLLIVAIQQIVGNFIEPKLMGKNLNISPIVTIIALAVWGQIWGVMGMLLSVPITVVMIIVFSQFESTKKVAILLSEKGELSENTSKN